MATMYEDGRYLEQTSSWHSEDSPWKAKKISGLLERNRLAPKRIVEVGCGAGQILEEMSRSSRLVDSEFTGIDISPQAIELCAANEASSVEYLCADISSASDGSYDLLMAIDVFEHVPDYLGFLEDCQRKAEYKIYHIPLDLHASSLVRASFINMRTSLGHLHYFTAESAIATLEDTGHEVIDSIYTCGAADLLKYHLTPKKIVASGPRWLASKVKPALGARYLGGFSLLVLAR